MINPLRQRWPPPSRRTSCISPLIAKRIIKEEVIKAGYKADKIILFGSRARGDYKMAGDWDFFAVIDRELLKKDRKIIKSNIHNEMRRRGILADVIIKPAGLYEHQKHDTGFLSYYVNKEGVNI